MCQCQPSHLGPSARSREMRIKSWMRLSQQRLRRAIWRLRSGSCAQMSSQRSRPLKPSKNCRKKHPVRSTDRRDVHPLEQLSLDLCWQVIGAKSDQIFPKRVKWGLWWFPSWTPERSDQLPKDIRPAAWCTHRLCQPDAQWVLPSSSPTCVFRGQIDSTC